MNAALDVHYSGPEAHAACVVFKSWSDSMAVVSFRVLVPSARAYRPGRFFERELPPLLAVLERSGERFSHIIIDGFVHLKNGEMGLGAHLHSVLPYSAAVIGVAAPAIAGMHGPYRIPTLLHLADRMARDV
jgi:deoxyribonuclease V